MPYLRHHRARPVAAIACLAALFLVGGQSLRAADVLPEGPLAIGSPAPQHFAGLYNVVRLSEKLYSGGVPEGDAGFEALRRLGIRTIITVDGAKPEVARARNLGMRYVHLPFGYDGCPTPQANAIVKAVRDLPGPVYIHCHHGRHRSPTAAAFARIALDGVSNPQAVSELERAGTGKNYTGLYADVRSYVPPSEKSLDALKATFPEVAPTPRLVEAMVAIDVRFERLIRRQKDGWKSAPGVDASYEALQLQELFTELNRTGDIEARPKEYRRWMADSERDARSLEAALRAGNSGSASMFLGKLASGCGSCHDTYRNVPQPGP